MIIRASDLCWLLNECSVVISINTISISLMEVTLNSSSYAFHSIPHCRNNVHNNYFVSLLEICC